MRLYDRIIKCIKGKIEEAKVLLHNNDQAVQSDIDAMVEALSSISELKENKGKQLQMVNIR